MVKQNEYNIEDIKFLKKKLFNKNSGNENDLDKILTKLRAIKIPEYKYGTLCIAGCTIESIDYLLPASLTPTTDAYGRMEWATYPDHAKNTWTGNDDGLISINNTISASIPKHSTFRFLLNLSNLNLDNRQIIGAVSQYIAGSDAYVSYEVSKFYQSTYLPPEKIYLTVSNLSDKDFKIILRYIHFKILELTEYPLSIWL